MLHTHAHSLVQQHRPSDSLTIALDGPAPFAKLETQRRRRLSKAGPAVATESSKKKRKRPSLSTLVVTPGTVFMARVDRALVEWAEHRSSSGLPPRSIVLDPSACPGEGEIKIFRHLMDDTHELLVQEGAGDAARTSLQAGVECAVLGGDSDLILLALASPCQRVRVINDAVRGQGGHSFSKERFVGELQLAAAGDPICGRRGHQELVDSFVLLCLLSGNDYMGRLGGFDLGLAFEAWKNTGCPTLVHGRGGGAGNEVPAPTTKPVRVQAAVPDQSSSLVSVLAQLASRHKDGALTPEEFTAAKAAAIASHTGANNPTPPTLPALPSPAAATSATTAVTATTATSCNLRINLAALGAVLAALPDMTVSASEVPLQARCSEYVRSLLWTVTMYAEAKCPDYGYTLPARFQIPSCCELVSLIAFD